MKHNNIRIIMNRAELKGTCYVELLPGPYINKCWNEGSLFIEEEVFGYLEPIIQKHVPAYDHYDFTAIDQAQWFAIADDLDALKPLLVSAAAVAELQQLIGFRSGGVGTSFAKDFEANKTALIGLISEFSSWVAPWRMSMARLQFLVSEHD